MARKDSRASRTRNCAARADYAELRAHGSRKSKPSRAAGCDRFDCLMLHNPDSIGYTSDAVWKAMEKVQDAGLTERLGVAPGPANGFSLDLILNLERFGALLDWAMIILNPLEPWPGSYALPAAEKCDVKIITRVVDYGGLFHDDVKPGHQFGKSDHRAFRPLPQRAGWRPATARSSKAMRPVCRSTTASPCCNWRDIWNLSPRAAGEERDPDPHPGSRRRREADRNEDRRTRRAPRESRCSADQKWRKSGASATTPVVWSLKRRAIPRYTGEAAAATAGRSRNDLNSVASAAIDPPPRSPSTFEAKAAWCSRNGLPRRPR